MPLRPSIKVASMKRNSLIMICITMAALGFLAWNVWNQPPQQEKPNATAIPTQAVGTATFVGKTTCQSCHTKEFDQWQESHHDFAMQEVNDHTVLGNFNHATFTHFGVTSTFSQQDGKYLVNTEGPQGILQDYEIRYTFGITPLQQYLIEFPGGRVQALGIAWDSRAKVEGGQRWFHLYPDEKIAHDDELHWTGPNQNWNYMCAECHSTDLQKKYSLEKNQYDTSWTDIDVACEACHGPGSQHVAWAKKVGGSQPQQRTTKGLVVQFPINNEKDWRFISEANTATQESKAPSHTEIEACARCHSRRTTIHNDYVHGKPLLDTHALALLEEALYHVDGQIQDEVYVYGSFLQSKMYKGGVMCSDCHEPHSLKLRETGNALCTRCHRLEHFDTPTHHFHKVGSDGAQCVNCHMPAQTYMVIDPRRDHSMRIPRPDLSEKLSSPNACNQCHKKQTSQWAADSINKWFGGQQQKEQHFGEVLQAGREGAPGAEGALTMLIDETSQPGIVRASALSLLGRYPSPRMVEALKVGMKDKDPLVRIGAVRSLS